MLLCILSLFIIQLFDTSLYGWIGWAVTHYLGFVRTMDCNTMVKIRVITTVKMSIICTSEIEICHGQDQRMTK